MKKFFLALSLFFLFSLNGFTQSPSPTATPKPAEEDDDIVKISTALIQIDVTVTDKNGKVVTDLKPEDFEIYENSQKQEITNFSFISSSPNMFLTTEKLLNKTPSNVKNINSQTVATSLPVASVRPEEIRRTIALVIDDLGLSAQSIAYVRKALKKFINEQMQPNDLVAILQTGSTGGSLQQFTTDKRQLNAAIENIKYNMQGRAGVTPIERIHPTVLEQARAAGDSTITAEHLREERQRDLEMKTLREERFAVGTLGAATYIVRGMRTLPGRKSIMLFSDGFFISPSFEDSERGSRTLKAMQLLIDQANRSSITINTTDARRLQYTGLDASDDTSAQSSGVETDEFGRPAAGLGLKMQDRENDIFQKQDGLIYLAKETGGEAFYNRNNIEEPIVNILENQSNFYLIGYQPDAEFFNATERRYNKLEVKVKNPDLKVSYRSGFFGGSEKEVVAPPKTPAQQLRTSLASPFAANDISLRLNALFGKNLKEGAFVQSFLHIKAQDLNFTKEINGSYKATFDVLAIGFGIDGMPMEQLSKSYTLNVNEEKYKEILNRGFVYDFLFPIKKAGAYQMRVAIRDTVTSKIGSASQFIYVPDSKKEKVTLSGIVLQNFTQEQWKDVQNAGLSQKSRDSLFDNSLRRFKQGTVLKYGGEIYLGKGNLKQALSLQTQIKIFRDGNIIMDSKTDLITPEQSEKSDVLNFIGALNLVDGLQPGEYILQIVVTDSSSKEKDKSVAQTVSFEIIK